jgi:hypothetical protein
LPALEKPKTFGIRLKQPKHLTKQTSHKAVKNAYKKRYSSRSNKLKSEVSGPVPTKNQDFGNRHVVPVILTGNKPKKYASTTKLPNYRRGSQPVKPNLYGSPVRTKQPKRILKKKNVPTKKLFSKSKIESQKNLNENLEL